MEIPALFEHLRKFDTPTIVNALEIAGGGRAITGFTRQTLVAAFPALPPIVGYARTSAIRCSTPFDPVVRRQMQTGYYDYLDAGNKPTIAIVQDVDSLPGVGAFWGEVNTHVHRGLGCMGAVTNGSMRDLDAMDPRFQCLAGSLCPSHAWVQVVEFGKPVDIFGMAVKHDDVVHADRHGAVVIPAAFLDRIPAAIDLMARKEKVILDAAKAPGFTAAKMREALAASEQVK
ncbi:MAG TPA: RraA family protein [Burkholderiales bacterium]|nr:RraA family protein [Burkholderiales bacterium]